MTLFDQLQEFAFASDDVAHVEPCKFVLMRQGGCQLVKLVQTVQRPVVKRTLVFKLERADTVSDAFERVFDRMGKGVHRVDAPLVACAVVGGMPDPVQDGVAQIDIGRRHLNFCA